MRNLLKYTIGLFVLIPLSITILTGNLFIFITSVIYYVLGGSNIMFDDLWSGICELWKPIKE